MDGWESSSGEQDYPVLGRKFFALSRDPVVVLKYPADGADARCGSGKWGGEYSAEGETRRYRRGKIPPDGSDGADDVGAVARGDIRRGGNKELFAGAGYKTLAGWSYRSMWWVSHNSHGAFTARGIYGQAVYIDPKAEMVIVRFASHPMAANANLDPTSLPAYEALAEYLMGGAR